METEESITKAALKLRLERANTVAGLTNGDVDEVLQRKEFGEDKGGKVATQAARVVSQPAIGAGVSSQPTHGKAHRTNVQFHALRASV